MKSSLPLIVFADINSPFLNGEPKAVPSVVGDALAREDVVLVLCSSMTRAEIEICQQELGLMHPLICESGAAVLIPVGDFPFEVPRDKDLPGYHAIEFGQPYSVVSAQLHGIANRLNIPVTAFSDLSTEGVAQACALSLSHARLAKLREYDEPFRLVTPTLQAHDRLWKALHAAGLSCTFSAAFEHVGAGADKGAGVSALTRLYQRAFGRVVTMGLGSAANSAALLRRVNWPFILQTASDGPIPQPLRGVPRLLVEDTRTAWIDTILELALRARAQRTARRSAAG